jgi:hypothetical protein
MVVPIGFSPGDFVTLVKLVANTVSVIREVTGATDESRQIISSLECLQTTLDYLASQVDVTGRDLSSSIGLPLSEPERELANKIGVEVDHCRRLLQNFCTENRKLLSGGKFSRARKILVWKYMKPQQLTRLRESLEPRLGALVIFMGVKRGLVEIPSLTRLAI